MHCFLSLLQCIFISQPAWQHVDVTSAMTLSCATTSDLELIEFQFDTTSSSSWWMGCSNPKILSWYLHLHTVILFCCRMCPITAKGSTTCYPCPSALTQQSRLWATRPVMAPVTTQIQTITCMSSGVAVVLHAVVGCRPELVSHETHIGFWHIPYRWQLDCNQELHACMCNPCVCWVWLSGLKV